jgi:hypothetical protein
MPNVTPTMKTGELEKIVLQMPPRKRAKIASRILESLTPETERALSGVWGREAEARIAAFDAGEIAAKPASHVLAYRGKRKG